MYGPFSGRPNCGFVGSPGFQAPQALANRPTAHNDPVLRANSRHRRTDTEHAESLLDSKSLTLTLVHVSASDALLRAGFTVAQGAETCEPVLHWLCSRFHRNSSSIMSM